MKTSIIIISICALLSCACEDTTTGTSQQINGFAIYKLADTTIQTSQIWNASLDSLLLSSTPFLTEKDLKAYYWSTHLFVTNSSVDSEFNKMKYLGGKSGGVPFVVAVNQDRIYLGTFWWAYSSSMPQVPYILTDAPSPYRINREYLSTTPDKRNDSRIYEALKAAGVLQE